MPRPPTGLRPASPASRGRTRPPRPDRRNAAGALCRTPTGGAPAATRALRRGVPLRLPSARGSQVPQGTGLRISVSRRGGAMAGSTDSLRVGIFPTTGQLGNTDDAAAYLERVHDAGIDHVCCGDHVSFFVGVGLDGLLQATALAMLHPTLPVMTGVYLLPLRHPVLV